MICSFVNASNSKDKDACNLLSLVLQSLIILQFWQSGISDKQIDLSSRIQKTEVAK